LSISIPMDRIIPRVSLPRILSMPISS